MKLKTYILFTCILLLTTNQACFSGNDQTSGANPTKRVAVRPRHNHNSSIEGPSVQTMARYRITSKVSPEVKIEEVNGQPTSPTRKVPLLQIEPPQQVAASLNRPEKEDKDIFTTSNIEKEEHIELETYNSHNAKAPSDNLNENLTLGFPISPNIPVLPCIMEPNVYTILFYGSLSKASHPLATELNKLVALEKRKVKIIMEDYVKKDLYHWGTVHNKIKEAEEIYTTLLNNAQNAESIKVGLKPHRNISALLIQNQEGKVLLLGVPDLNFK